MTTKLGLMTLFVAVVMVFAARTAKADCVGIEDFGSENCSGVGGCEGSYEMEFCSFGCVSGECNGRGSSGECCGRIYYIPNIYGDGGKDAAGLSVAMSASGLTRDPRASPHSTALSFFKAIRQGS
jgi:hypothetical protein